MSHFDFSVEKIISQAWIKFKENSLFWIGVTLFSIAIGLPGNIIPSFALLFTLLSCYFSAAITLMSIKYIRGQSISYNDLLAIKSMRFLHYLAALLICSVLIIIGCVFLILPGIYIMLRLMLVQYLIVDKDISFDQAIKKSWHLTKGMEWNLLAFVFAMFVIMVLGFLALCLGLIIAIPVTQLSTAYLYLIILENADKLNVSNNLDTDTINFDR